MRRFVQITMLPAALVVGAVGFDTLESFTVSPRLGVHATPAPTARLMASMFEYRSRTLRLLDAGAGGGALTAAWIAEVWPVTHS